MYRVLCLVLLATQLAATAHAGQCFKTSYDQEHCWYESGVRWCQTWHTYECAGDPTSYTWVSSAYVPPQQSAAGHGSDPVGGALLLLLLLGGLLAFFPDETPETPSDEAEIDEETISLEDLTARVEEARAEADAYIAKIISEARRAGLADDDDV